MLRPNRSLLAQTLCGCPLLGEAHVTADTDGRWCSVAWKAHSSPALRQSRDLPLARSDMPLETISADHSHPFGVAILPSEVGMLKVQA